MKRLTRQTGPIGGVQFQIPAFTNW